MEVPEDHPAPTPVINLAPIREPDIRCDTAEEHGQKIHKNARREYFLDTINVGNPAKRDKEQCCCKKKDIGNPAQ